MLIGIGCALSFTTLLLAFIIYYYFLLPPSSPRIIFCIYYLYAKEGRRHGNKSVILWFGNNDRWVGDGLFLSYTINLISRYLVLIQMRLKVGEGR